MVYASPATSGHGTGPPLQAHDAPTLLILAIRVGDVGRFDLSHYAGYGFCIIRL
jgi:hypothetical protein